LGMLCSTFFSTAPYFIVKRFQLHALSSRKRVELWEHLKRYSTNFSFLWSCSMVEFVEQSLLSSPKHLLRFESNSWARHLCSLVRI
jgi:hypothetical protein